MPPAASSMRNSSNHHHGAASVPAGSGVQVLVRVRPPLPRELMYDSGVEVQPPHDVKVYNDTQEFSGRYHHVFGEELSQPEVYEKFRDAVPLALAGYNSTIFAYGQTGTGKTFTMMGDDPAMDGAAPGVGGGGGGGAGIIPRAVKELFREAKAKQDAEGAAIQVIVSYMEIYNDRLHDLLQPYKPHSSRDPADMNQKRAVLEVREDPRGLTYVPNLLCVKVKSYKSVYQLIAKGNRNRAVRHTEMNQASSRSHAILQLVIEQWPNGGADGTVLRSKLNFVDLAGSERWNTAAGVWGWEGGGAGGGAGGAEAVMGEERINEMTAINGSLSALGSVVAALTERRSHVPYRDSRLTHLLQDSLGGNCRTTVLATLSPSVDAFEESCSTLRFADRARAIANNPVVNASRDVGSILALKEREIQRLRNMISQFTSGGKAPMTPSGQEGADNAAARLSEELEATRRALELERALRAELQQRLHHASGGTPGEAGGGGGGSGTMVLTLGTSATAFDAAAGGGGTPPTAPPRAGSLRSSVGSAGSAGGPRAGGGADFFRLSTPSTPLNSVPFQLTGSAGAAVASSGGAPLVPTRAGGGGGGSGPQVLSRSRSNVLSSNLGFPGGGDGGQLASPGAGKRGGGGGGAQRRLSYDEAVMAIKSQIISLSKQERMRLKARQPPQGRIFWGGPPPDANQGTKPAAATTTAAATAPPPSFNTRTKAAVGIYGGSGGGGGGSGAASPTAAAVARHQQRRPPPVSAVGAGVVASAGFGGGSLALIHSIDLTDSPSGSNAPSPASFAAGLGKQSQPQRQRQPQQQEVLEAGSRGPSAMAGIGAASRANGFVGPGTRDDGGGGDDAVPVDMVADETEGQVREEAGVEEDGVVGGEKDKGGEEEYSEDDYAEDEVEGDDDEGDTTGRYSRGSAGGSRAKGAVNGGGDGDSDCGLSQLDPEEYEAIMREAREALAGKSGGDKPGTGQGPQSPSPGTGRGGLAAAATAAGGGGVGGGRSAMLTQQPASTVPSECGGRGGGGGGDGVVSVVGTGWGRNALLNKFTDADTTPLGSGGGGGGGFGRSSFLAATAAAAPPAVSAPATAPPGGGGGWGRKSILTRLSAAADSPPPPQPPASADAAANLAASSKPALGRRALIAELLSDGRDNGGGGGGSSGGGAMYGMYGAYGVSSSPSRMRSSGGGASGPKGRSKSVGTNGRSNGGSRGHAADRGTTTAKLDAGSWIYILGTSASSTKAKHVAAALQLDPKTGLPAL